MTFSLKKKEGKHLPAIGIVALCLFVVLPAVAQQAAADWQQQVRDLLARQDLTAALVVTEKRLAAAPQDLEALGWRARVLTRMDRLAEAEADYRRVLQTPTKDTDILSGLATVLTRQQRFAEALVLLSTAKALEPRRGDILVQRARTLRALGRTREAREDFAAAARLDPQDPEARAGLISVRMEPRHLLRIGNDTDTFNYTGAAAVQSVSLDSRWTNKWATSFAGSAWERFGERAGKFTGAASYRLNHDTSVSAGGAVANDQSVISTGEAFFGLDRGFRFSHSTPVRGIEAMYDQHWLWFQDSHVLTVSPSLLFYLPREWTFLLKGTAARSVFPGLTPDWSPSGVAKLGFPPVDKLSVNVFFAVGTEDYSRIDQIGRFSARTYGGGLKYQFAPRQDLTGYVAYQSRTQGRTQTSFGLSYGLRF